MDRQDNRYPRACQPLKTIRGERGSGSCPSRRAGPSGDDDPQFRRGRRRRSPPGSTDHSRLGAPWHAEARYLEEMTGPEPAEMFEIPEGTVRSRLKRAKATIDDRLRRWEEGMGPDESPLSSKSAQKQRSRVLRCRADFHPRGSAPAGEQLTRQLGSSKQ